MSEGEKEISKIKQTWLQNQADFQKLQQEMEFGAIQLKHQQELRKEKFH